MASASVVLGDKGGQRRSSGEERDRACSCGPPEGRRGGSRGGGGGFQPIPGLGAQEELSAASGRSRVDGAASPAPSESPAGGPPVSALGPGAGQVEPVSRPPSSPSAWPGALRPVGEKTYGGASGAMPADRHWGTWPAIAAIALSQRPALSAPGPPQHLWSVRLEGFPSPDPRGAPQPPSTLTSGLEPGLRGPRRRGTGPPSEPSAVRAHVRHRPEAGRLRGRQESQAAGQAPSRRCPCGQRKGVSPRCGHQTKDHDAGQGALDHLSVRPFTHSGSSDRPPRGRRAGTRCGCCVLGRGREWRSDSGPWRVCPGAGGGHGDWQWRRQAPTPWPPPLGGIGAADGPSPGLTVPVPPWSLHPGTVTCRWAPSRARHQEGRTLGQGACPEQRDGEQVLGALGYQ